MTTATPYPFAVTCQWSPAPDLEWRRTDRAVEVEFAGGPALLLTRWADIRAVLADARFAPHIPGVPMSLDDANPVGCCSSCAARRTRGCARYSPAR